MMSVPVMSDGMRSGVNWMRLNSRPERLRDGAHHQRLGGAGKTGDQTMAADEERDENLIDHLLLADDDLADLVENAVAHSMEAVDAFLQFRGVQIHFSSSHRSFPFLGVFDLQE